MSVMSSSIVGSGLAFALSSFGFGPGSQLLLVAAMCIVSAWLGWKLHQACDEDLCRIV